MWVKEIFKRIGAKALCLIWVVLVVGCGSIRLISDYDEQNDSILKNIQEEVFIIISNLKVTVSEDSNDYTQTVSSYRRINLKIKLLEIRLKSADKTDIVLMQVSELKKIMNNMEKLHQMGFHNSEEIDLLDSQLTLVFVNLLRLQRALKEKTNRRYKIN